MKYLILFIIILTTTSYNTHHKATWYDTAPHHRVHRSYPTCAYNYAPRYSLLQVTNTRTGKMCVVEVTDRMGNRSANKIDLSKHAFGLIEDHKRGACYVIVTRINNKPDEQKQCKQEFESKKSTIDSASNN